MDFRRCFIDAHRYCAGLHLRFKDLYWHCITFPFAPIFIYRSAMLSNVQSMSITYTKQNWGYTAREIDVACFCWRFLDIRRYFIPWSIQLFLYASSSFIGLPLISIDNSLICIITTCIFLEISCPDPGSVPLHHPDLPFSHESAPFHHPESILLLGPWPSAPSPAKSQPAQRHDLCSFL